MVLALGTGVALGAASGAIQGAGARRKAQAQKRVLERQRNLAKQRGVEEQELLAGTAGKFTDLGGRRQDAIDALIGRAGGAEDFAQAESRARPSLRSAEEDIMALLGSRFNPQQGAGGATRQRAQTFQENLAAPRREADVQQLVRQLVRLPQAKSSSRFSDTMRALSREGGEVSDDQILLDELLGQKFGTAGDRLAQEGRDAEFAGNFELALGSLLGNLAPGVTERIALAQNTNGV